MGEITESELADAWQQGRLLDGAGNGSHRRLDAAIIRRCCQAGPGTGPPGLRLRNAVIVGRVDLSGLDLPFPVRFEDCEFDSALLLEGATLAELTLTGCAPLPGLLANGLSVRRDLDLSRSRVTGAHRTKASMSNRAAIWLCEADIGGRLLCADTVIEADGERALQADRMRVGGTVRLLDGFSARGEVRLLGARIGGSFDLTGARIDAPAGLALDLCDATIGGSVFFISDPSGRRPAVHGRVDMENARIFGQFLIRDATLQGTGAALAARTYSRTKPGGTVLNAARLSVGADVALEGSCDVSGGLDLSMSNMSGLSVSRSSSLHGPVAPALDLTNAELRGSLTVEPGTTVVGGLRLRGARIHGDLVLKEVTLRVPESTWVIAAQRVTVDGDVLLQDMSAAGGPVEFRGATLGSVVDATRARLTNPGGYTLSLHHAIVRGAVHLVEVESAGLLVLNQVSIGGRLQCTKGSFTCQEASEFNPHGHAIKAVSATVRGGMELGWARVSPSLDFTNASAAYLADDPANWPDTFIISGFTYDRFEQPPGMAAVRPWDQAARCTWLSQQESYDAGPYEQAARVFRGHGYSDEAEEILIAQRRGAGEVANAGRAFPLRLLDRIYGASIGYGYRPQRVLWLLVALLALVIVSLELPAGQHTLRAADSAGDVYSTSGLLRVAGPHSTTPAAGSAGTTPATSARPGTPPVDSCGNGQVRCFSPVLYAIDTVVPLVALDQRATWYPDPHTPGGSVMLWWLNAATLLGWLLSSIFVLSLARLARNS